MERLNAVSSAPSVPSTCRSASKISSCAAANLTLGGARKIERGREKRTSAKSILLAASFSLAWPGVSGVSGDILLGRIRCRHLTAWPKSTSACAISH